MLAIHGGAAEGRFVSSVADSLTEAAPYVGGPITVRLLTSAAPVVVVGDRASEAIRVEVRTD